MRRSGGTSRTASSSSSSELAVNSLVSVGILVCLGLIALSGILNFRFAYRMADTNLDGWLYGLCVGLAEFIKAICPFVMAWGWRHRSAGTVLVALVFFTVATGYSLTSATGYAAQHRLAKQLAAGSSSEQRETRRLELGRAQARLKALGTTRSPGEIEKAIETALKQPVGKITVGAFSSNCTLNRLPTREACLAVAVLAEELERSREIERLELVVDRLNEREAEQPIAAPAANAQVDAMMNVSKTFNTGISRQTVETVLAVLFAVLVELGSGVGLFLVTTPWRLGPLASTEPMDQEDISAMSQKLGYVDTFLDERLLQAENRQLTTGELFNAYLQWCREKGHVPYSKEVFGREFKAIARQVKIGSRGDAGYEVYLDVALAKTLARKR